MAPHAGFSRHVQSQRPTSPHENTSMGSAPEGASGSVTQRHQMLNPSPLLPTSEWLPMELTMPEYLRSVTGVEDLRQLKHLKLRVIAREASIQRIGIYAPGLLHLDLQGSVLGSLRDLGCGLVCLEVLSVSRCGLGSLDGTFGFPALKDLTASYNRIRDVAPCSAIENLRFLDVRGNPISDVECIRFLSVCPKLEELILSECPVAKEHQYRRQVLRILPSLLILDTIPTEDDAKHSTSTNEGRRVDREVEGEVTGGSSSSSSEEEESEEEDSYCSSERRGEEVSQGGLQATKKSSGKSRRAASAVPRLQGWSSATATGTRKKRPQTARPWRPPTGSDESTLSTSESSFALSEESPSSLTSGITLCGNIAAALLGNRLLSRQRLKEARRRVAGNSVGSEGSNPCEKAEDSGGEEKGSSPTEECREDLLEAAKKWREAYANFREKNREKWAKEDLEDEDEEKENGVKGRERVPPADDGRFSSSRPNGLTPLTLNSSSQAKQKSSNRPRD